MLRIASIVLMLCCLVVPAAAQPRPPAIPDTPAGKVLQAFLDAFNRGDAAKLRAYVTTYDPARNADELAFIRNMAGAVDLVAIDASDRLHIERAVNPISKTNWEGTGVEPDVAVPADQALDVAKKMAAEQLAKPKKR